MFEIFNNYSIEELDGEVDRIVSSICYDNFWDYKKYGNVYGRSNEYIRTANLISNGNQSRNEEDGKSLTVLSSGEHILQLLSEGYTDIDAFDINMSTYIHFIIQCIYIAEQDLESYSASRYNRKLNFDVINNGLSQISFNMQYVINRLIKNQNFVNYFRREQSSFLNDLSYLTNETSYELLKKKISSIFHNDIRVGLYIKSLTDFFKGNSSKYTFMNLSNIMSYVTFNESRLILEEINNHLSNNGIAIIEYVFKCWLDKRTNFIEYAKKNYNAKLLDLKDNKLLVLSKK